MGGIDYHPFILSLIKTNPINLSGFTKTRVKMDVVVWSGLRSASPASVMPDGKLDD